MLNSSADGVNAVDPLKIDLRPLAGLKPANRNARTHSDRQIEQIAASIQQFGFTNPILVNQDNEIVAGHGRAEASRRLGIALVPVIALAHLSPEEVRLGAVKHDEFAMAAGEMSEAEFEAFLAAVFRNQAEYSIDGAIHFQCMDWRHMSERDEPAGHVCWFMGI